MQINPNFDTHNHVQSIHISPERRSPDTRGGYGGQGPSSNASGHCGAGSRGARRPMPGIAGATSATGLAGPVFVTHGLGPGQKAKNSTLMFGQKQPVTQAPYYDEY